MEYKRIPLIFILLTIPIFLLFFLTLNFSSENIIFLSLILTIATSSLASPGFILTVRNLDNLSPVDVALTGVFAALIYVSNFALILFPSIFFYIIPFAAGITFYFPTAIIFGAYLTLTNKPGSSFSILLTYGIVSELFSPSLFWFPYYIGWGGLIESLYGVIGKLESKSDYAVMGFAYGEIGAALAVCYMLVGWGYYRPLFMSVPSVIVDGILAMIGGIFGYKIGLVAKSLPF